MGRTQKKLLSGLFSWKSDFFETTRLFQKFRMKLVQPLCIKVMLGVNNEHEIPSCENKLIKNDFFRKQPYPEEGKHSYLSDICI